MPKLKISKEEYAKRRKRVLNKIEEEDLDAICLFSPNSIFYLTHFGFLQTERPIAFIYTEDKEKYFFIPSLERDRIGRILSFDEMRTYPDYPGKKHPMKRLKEFFKDLNLDGDVIGVDSKSPPSVSGYHGPDLEELLPNTVFKKVMGEYLQNMMMVKSQEEIDLIKQAAKWGDVAHQKLQEYTEPGKNEAYVSSKASLDATMEMIDELGEEYRAYKGRSGAHSGFRGQIGEHSSLPHSVSINAAIQEGDVLVTGAGANVGEYGSELERTMIVGEPTDKQKKYFKLMKKSQEVAFDTIKAGIKCSKVDKAVRKFYREKGIMNTWRHHTGHGIGLKGHEPPFFDVGDDTTLKAGMVMSVEPGMYIPDFAGFRHSDTVVVTETGMERVTRYPRELEELKISV